MQHVPSIAHKNQACHRTKGDSLQTNSGNNTGNNSNNNNNDNIDNMDSNRLLYCLCQFDQVCANWRFFVPKFITRQCHALPSLSTDVTISTNEKLCSWSASCPSPSCSLSSVSVTCRLKTRNANAWISQHVLLMKRLRSIGIAISLISGRHGSGTGITWSR